MNKTSCGNVKIVCFFFWLTKKIWKNNESGPIDLLIILYIYKPTPTKSTSLLATNTFMLLKQSSGKIF